MFERFIWDVWEGFGEGLFGNGCLGGCVYVGVVGWWFGEVKFVLEEVGGWFGGWFLCFCRGSVDDFVGELFCECVDLLGGGDGFFGRSRFVWLLGRFFEFG